jgi:hypothetical protein
MGWGFFGRVVLGIALVVGVISLGAGVYQAGFVAGVATEGNVAVAPAVGYGFGWHGGFGLFGFLGFFVFLFLLFGLFRALAWRGPRAWGGRGWGPGYGPGSERGPRGDHGHGRFGPWEGRAQEAFDDWHRRAHEPEGPTEPGPDAPR